MNIKYLRHNYIVHHIFTNITSKHIDATVKCSRLVDREHYCRLEMKRTTHTRTTFVTIPSRLSTFPKHKIIVIKGSEEISNPYRLPQV